MRLPLGWVAKTLTAARDVPDDLSIAGFSIDSRTLEQGDLFFAIHGSSRDGHGFVADALRKGAAAAVVRRRWDAPPETRGGLLLRVDEPAEALAELAAAARRRWGGTVVAVTGSNGKTTTKEACAACLAAVWKTAKTPGNLNNELGLPLSILRIPDGAEVAVLEMGMNHRGEIRKLARIAAPGYGVVTNVSAAHLGAFAAVEEVALAKRELIEELGPQGTAVLNADDPLVREFGSVHAGKTVTFGLDAPLVGRRPDFGAADLEEDPERGLSFRLTRRGRPLKTAAFTSQLRGRHNAANLLAAIAVAVELGAPPARLKEAIANLAPGSMRGVLRRFGGVRVIDDCYNSNPAAAEAMLGVLASSQAERRIAVLGEMRELGEHSAELHRRAGRAAAGVGVDLLCAVHGGAREILAGAIEAGMPPERTLFFEDPAAAGLALRSELREGDVVLVKGSRGVELERAIAAAFPGAQDAG
jgi:UDP-N-acetylmuramoyl-tripeptide--D-alanyl-D-alanine ligase